MDGICPNCGCNPQDEPYCMVATHCPQCGYGFNTNLNGMTDERRSELLSNMLEYLSNYGIDLSDAGITDKAEGVEAYDGCLSYIVELVGSDGDANFFENVLGFTKEELAIEGIVA